MCQEATSQRLPQDRPPASTLAQSSRPAPVSEVSARDDPRSVVARGLMRDLTLNPHVEALAERAAVERLHGKVPGAAAHGLALAMLHLAQRVLQLGPKVLRDRGERREVFRPLDLPIADKLQQREGKHRAVDVRRKPHIVLHEETVERAIPQEFQRPEGDIQRRRCEGQVEGRVLAAKLKDLNCAAVVVPHKVEQVLQPEAAEATEVAAGIRSAAEAEQRTARRVVIGVRRQAAGHVGVCGDLHDLLEARPDWNRGVAEVDRLS
eukprot:NODE_2392_length_944_cov_350.473566.p1 GENE.NODE_2392_length_944_cov_350.473566~~NODE_2392_length_944_cov_350.473566.p1  ORF type:complete len:292 (-),score=90.00 NODE_2392_length_944_cov_350.473566:67-858(-)